MAPRPLFAKRQRLTDKTVDSSIVANESGNVVVIADHHKHSVSVAQNKQDAQFETRAAFEKLPYAPEANSRVDVRPAENVWNLVRGVPNCGLLGGREAFNGTVV